MKTFSKASIFVAALLAAVTLCRAQEVPRSGELPFDFGEKVNYSVSYNWLGVMTDVAGAYTLVRSDGGLYNMVLYAKTAKFFDAFFKVLEDYESWTDGDLNLRKGSRESHEGSYWAFNTKTYAADGKSVHVEMNKSSKGQKTLDVALDRKTYDLPSILYYVRTIDASTLKVGEALPVQYLHDDGVTKLYLTYKGIENKYLKGVGTVRCHKYSLTVVSDDAMFDGSEDASLWLSDDDNRLLVYFRAPLKIGAVAGRMTSCEGTKYPFDSLISEKRVR